MAARDQLDRTLAALAEPKRRQTVDLLRARPMRAGDLAEALTLTPPATSRHLRVLRQAGLVEERSDAADARVRIYSLASAGMRELHDWLAETETLWSDQLDAFRRHVDAAAK